MGLWNGKGTGGFILYLLVAFSVAVFSVSYVGDTTNPIHHHLSSLSATEKIWPDLKFSWKLVLATVIAFLGSACGTVGGVGGGGIFVPMLTLILGFDTKSAAAISKCMIMGASASSVWYNVRVRHPTKEVPILDYDLALLFQPMLLLGITVGVSLSVVFPYWLITVLIIILFVGTSSRSFFKGIEMWKEETLLKNEMAQQRANMVNSRGELLIDTEYEPLYPREEKSELEIIRSNLKWKGLLILVTVWLTFLLIQIVKNEIKVCSTIYWILFIVQFPVALAVFGFEASKLYTENKKRLNSGNTECGLLGSGGGFVLGPLLLEIGVIPQVASATATFVMMFSSSLSVVEFYLLKRFPIPYAMYLISVSILAGFWGQSFIRKLVAILRRASIIVFVLSGVICASALTMGVIGIEKSIKMIHNHEFMGFLGFCSSQ
ncbi:unnamed protein product [Arabidopsis thaliana]|uniref:(thale cress) hypothetical protein n=1 Tax=Arabidopsis thaliana TaxID=3702 RepID=A0A7G2EDR8_ARATH|nr:unnamed protein product [Arabidopsis thaliana]